MARVIAMMDPVAAMAIANSDSRSSFTLKLHPFVEFILFCTTFVVFNITGHIYAIYHQFIKKRIVKEPDQYLVFSNTPNGGMDFEIRKGPRFAPAQQSKGIIIPDIIKYLEEKTVKTARCKYKSHPAGRCMSGYDASGESDF